MEHVEHLSVLKDILVFLIAAGLIVPLLRAVRVPAVLGFILAGIALGPFGLGALREIWPFLDFLTLSNPEAAAPFAELGVLFLLFLLGLELSVERLWTLRRIVFGTGPFQVGASALVIGLIAHAFGLPAETAAMVGLALALSSTAIVMQLLIDARCATQPIGRTSLGVLLLQDLLVAPILIYVVFVSDGGEHNIWLTIGESLLNGLAAFAAIFVVGRFFLRRIFSLAARVGGRDFLMALTLLALVGAATITQEAGLSLALGAFLAGLLLGETEFKHQAEIDLEPFKGLLLGLFFMTVGMGLDLSTIAVNWSLVAGGIAALIAIKATITLTACWLFARRFSTAVEAAFLLAPAGEFAFVVLGAGQAGGLIEAEPATLIAAIAGLSMMLTPGSWMAGRALARRVPAKSSPSPDDPFPKIEHQYAIIAGFGRVGQAVAKVLDKEEIGYVAVERNAMKVKAERDRGASVYLGDAARHEILEAAGIRQCDLVIITLDDASAGERLVSAIRAKRADIPILARAHDVEHARALYAAGASFVVPDAIEAALQMAAQALQVAGFESDTARDRIAAERLDAYRQVEEQ